MKMDNIIPYSKQVKSIYEQLMLLNESQQNHLTAQQGLLTVQTRTLTIQNDILKQLSELKRHSESTQQNQTLTIQNDMMKQLSEHYELTQRKLAEFGSILMDIKSQQQCQGNLPRLSWAVAITAPYLLLELDLKNLEEHQ
jgi:hypothetical protein